MPVSVITGLIKSVPFNAGNTVHGDAVLRSTHFHVADIVPRCLRAGIILDSETVEPGFKGQMSHPTVVIGINVRSIPLAQMKITPMGSDGSQGRSSQNHQ